jgi:TRAP-type C4-dicarboxylate transport system permease small subunit
VSTETASAEPHTALGRLDRLIYGIEQGIITGALLVMTMTYFLQIVHREMHAEINAFDKLILRMRGYDTISAAQAVDGVIASTTGLYTPMVLGCIGFIMGILALRTRARASLAEGQAYEPGPLWRRCVGALTLVAVSYAGLWMVEVVAARWICLLGLLAMVICAVRIGVRSGAWLAVASAVVGGGLIGAFFLVSVEEGYIWASEFSNLMLMYVGFLGASMATRDARHIQVDAVRKNVSPRLLPLYNAVSGGVTLFFCGLLLVLTFHYMAERIEAGSRLEATELPEVLMSLPVGVSLLLMELRFLARAIKDLQMFRRGELPEATGPGLH